jgi:hypothetical protein
MLHFERALTRRAILKNLKWVLPSLALVLVLAIGGYWIYRGYSISKEASLSCVATSFPYVVMEHKRAELSNLLENIHLDEKGEEEPDLDAVDKAMKGEKPKPTHFFLSEEIDTMMLDLAQSIQSRPAKAPPLSGEEMTAYLHKMEPLFQKQASGYFSECTTLFSSMIKKCGSVQNSQSQTEDESEDCRSQYDSQVDALLQKYIAGPGGGD